MKCVVGFEPAAELSEAADPSRALLARLVHTHIYWGVCMDLNRGMVGHNHPLYH